MDVLGGDFNICNFCDFGAWYIIPYVMYRSLHVDGC